MPLYSIPNMNVILKIPHDHVNRALINKISLSEYSLIQQELNRRIDSVLNSPEELLTAGWIPGHDWTGTVWYPIYLAANKDQDRAAMVFGAIVFEVMMNRPEEWSLGKYQINGIDIGSTTYFRIHI